MYYTLSLVLTYYYLLLVHKRMSGQCKYVHRLFYQLPYLICSTVYVYEDIAILSETHIIHKIDDVGINLFETNYDVIFVHITFNYI